MVEILMWRPSRNFIEPFVLRIQLKVVLGYVSTRLKRPETAIFLARFPCGVAQSQSD